MTGEDGFVPTFVDEGPMVVAVLRALWAGMPAPSDSMGRRLHAILAAADRVSASGGVQPPSRLARLTAHGAAMAPSFWEGVHPGRCA